jgi:membrane associated rhomboid family serine protease
MIPLKDENPTHITPFVNYSLIAINILVFVYQMFITPDAEAFVMEHALIPAQLLREMDLRNIARLFTSMFMHGGILHLGGNMLYLWIFGDNVEDAMGHGRYLIFYLLGGLLATAIHIVTSPGSQIPTLGASGAIAAALGAYLILYPRSRVLSLIPLGFFMRLTMVPAVIVLGLWFLLQLFQGVLALGGPDVGGVAFWAHIGGFVAGFVLAKLFANRELYERMPRWQ